VEHLGDPAARRGGVHVPDGAVAEEAAGAVGDAGELVEAVRADVGEEAVEGEGRDVDLVQ
jgi:hypothetical protein